MRISYKHTTIKELVKGLNVTSSINLMKVVGAFVKPNAMTNHSKKPSLDLNALFHTLVGSMGTWWYPDFRSILLKNFSPLSWSRRSSIQGIGYWFLTVILFNAL
jgi:cyanate permease